MGNVGRRRQRAGSRVRRCLTNRTSASTAVPTINAFIRRLSPLPLEPRPDGLCSETVAEPASLRDHRRPRSVAAARPMAAKRYRRFDSVADSSPGPSRLVLNLDKGRRVRFIGEVTGNSSPNLGVDHGNNGPTGPAVPAKTVRSSSGAPVSTAQRAPSTHDRAKVPLTAGNSVFRAGSLR